MTTIALTRNEDMEVNFAVRLAEANGTLTTPPAVQITIYKVNGTNLTEIWSVLGSRADGKYKAKFDYLDDKIQIGQNFQYKVVAPGFPSTSAVSMLTMKPEVNITANILRCEDETCASVDWGTPVSFCPDESDSTSTNGTGSGSDSGSESGSGQGSGGSSSAPSQDSTAAAACGVIYAVPFSGNRLRVFFDHVVRSVGAEARFWRLNVSGTEYEPISVGVVGVNAVELEFGTGVPTDSGRISFAGRAGARGVQCSSGGAGDFQASVLEFSQPLLQFAVEQQVAKQWNISVGTDQVLAALAKVLAECAALGGTCAPKDFDYFAATYKFQDFTVVKAPAADFPAFNLSPALSGGKKWTTFAVSQAKADQSALVLLSAEEYNEGELA